jgi:transcriptional regulator with XRE-family HTH domain
MTALWVIVDAMTFANRLTEARKLRGLKQAQLARLASVTGAWVSKAESGLTVDVQARALFAVSRALRVNPEWLAEGVGPRDLVPTALAAELADLTEDQRTVVRSVIQSIKK